MVVCAEKCCGHRLSQLEGNLPSVAGIRPTSPPSPPSLHCITLPYIISLHTLPYIALYCLTSPPPPPFQHYLASPRQVYFTLAQHASEEHTLL